MNALFPIFVIILLILLNGIFVSAEFAIIAAPRTRLQQLSRKGSFTAKRVLEIIHDPQKLNQYFTTVQTGITIASLGLGMYGEHTLAELLLKLFHPIGYLSVPAAHTIAMISSVSLLTYMHVVIGEMIPKSLALQSAEKTVLMIYSPMAVVEKLFFPLVFILNHAAFIVTKIMRLPPANPNDRFMTTQELEYIVDKSYEVGVIEPSDHLFIDNILDLNERITAHVMTPRKNIIAIPSGANLQNTMDIVCSSTKTRFPVYTDDLDQVIGTLHIKDLARFLNKDHELLDFKIEYLIREPFFIPETMPLNDLLQKFHDNNQMIAVVFDEFGGTSGIITLEDLIEEVVGEIHDEYDTDTVPIDELSSKVLRVQGNVILAELNQLYDLDWDHPDVITIGGLVMLLLGRIPKPNDSVIYKNTRIFVESMNGQAVGQILIYLS